jgi:hypothetical protein
VADEAVFDEAGEVLVCSGMGSASAWFGFGS